MPPLKKYVLYLQDIPMSNIVRNISPTTLACCVKRKFLLYISRSIPILLYVSKSILSMSTSSSSFVFFLWVCLCDLYSFLLLNHFPHSSHLCTSCTCVCLFKSFLALNFFWQITQIDSMCCCMCFFKRYSFGFLTKHLLQTKLVEPFPTCCLLMCCLK